VAEEEIITFIRQGLGSVYALELLLLIKRHSSRVWHAGDLVRDLRSSRTAVSDALARLIQAGLVSETSQGRYIFAPSSPEHAKLAAAIEQLYISAPMSVMTAIVAAPGKKQEALPRAFKRQR